MNQQITIAACQLVDIQDDLDQSLTKIIETATHAAENGAQLVCFPECYLQGYTVDERQAREPAIDGVF